jgi:segregation and condensation protein B
MQVNKDKQMTKELNFFQSELETIDVEMPNLASNISEIIEEQTPIDHHLMHYLKRVIEALLFTSSDPLPLNKIREIIDTICAVRPRQLRQILEELQQDYLTQQRAFRLEEIAQGYVIRTHEEYAPYIDLLYRQKRGEKLSHAATEVLAIIAYRQPITRPQIDAIRGVDSSGTLSQLLERNLVESLGKLEAPGRPTLYGTTKEFLKHFGLKDLTELTKK